MKESKKAKNLKSLDQLIEEEFGPTGTKNRENFENGSKAFERFFLDKKRNGTS